MDTSNAVVFCAYGTRGDVQPMAVLAKAAQDSSKLQVCLITHRSHLDWLGKPPFNILTVRCVASLPARDWRDATSTHSQEQQHLETFEAIQSTLPAAAHPRPLLVFNLFALECYHCAEHFRLPVMAVSPYMIPYRCPAAWPSRFKQALPNLWAALHASHASGQVHAGSECTMTFSEVQHWMWPLFDSKWQALRDHLSLPAWPLQGVEEGEEAVPPAVQLLYGFSDLVAPRPGYWPNSVATCGFWQAPVDWFAEQALPTELNTFLGTCQPGAASGEEDQLSEGPAGPAPPTSPKQAGQQLCGGRAPLCVDFGSMGTMGLIPDALYTLSVLACALTAVGRSAVVLTAGWPALHEAYSKLDPAHCDLIYLQREPVPHQLLLPRCVALLHHGGSGTTAAGLMAGLPQLLAPVQFDQFFWAERLSYLELTPPPLEAQVLYGRLPGPDYQQHQEASENQQFSGQAAGQGPRTEAVTSSAATLAARLESLLQAPGKAACMAFAQELQQEDGIAVALGHMQRLLTSKNHHFPPPPHAS